VVDVMPGLQVGATSPPPSQVLMHLAAQGRWSAVAYIDESTARAVRQGQEAHIGLDAAPLQRWSAHVESVATQPSSVMAEAMLVQAHGGMIDAREAQGGWVPAQSLYRVTLSLDSQPSMAPRSWRGHVVVRSEPQSLAQRAWQRLSAAWVREAGF
jgi:putative peptide zinc metalloprotease protein